MHQPRHRHNRAVIQRNRTVTLDVLTEPSLLYTTMRSQTKQRDPRVPGIAMLNFLLESALLVITFAALWVACLLYSRDVKH